MSCKAHQKMMSLENLEEQVALSGSGDPALIASIIAIIIVTA